MDSRRTLYMALFGSFGPLLWASKVLEHNVFVVPIIGTGNHGFGHIRDIWRLDPRGCAPPSSKS